MNLKPLDDRIVVRPNEPETKSKGGIVLPDMAKEKPVRGVVLAVGPGRLLENGQRAAMSVQVTDEVVYARYGGSPVEEDEEELLILREGDILAVIG